MYELIAQRPAILYIAILALTVVFSKVASDIKAITSGRPVPQASKKPYNPKLCLVVDARGAVASLATDTINSIYAAIRRPAEILVMVGKSDEATQKALIIFRRKNKHSYRIINVNDSNKHKLILRYSKSATIGVINAGDLLKPDYAVALQVFRKQSINYLISPLQIMQASSLKTAGNTILNKSVAFFDPLRTQVSIVYCRRSKLGRKITANKARYIAPTAKSFKSGIAANWWHWLIFTMFWTSALWFLSYEELVLLGQIILAVTLLLSAAIVLKEASLNAGQKISHVLIAPYVLIYFAVIWPLVKIFKLAITVLARLFGRQ